MVIRIKLGFLSLSFVVEQYLILYELSMVEFRLTKTVFMISNTILWLANITFVVYLYTCQSIYIDIFEMSLHARIFRYCTINYLFKPDVLSSDYCFKVKKKNMNTISKNKIKVLKTHFTVYWKEKQLIAT